MTVLKEVPHFPHPDQGDILKSSGMYLYVDIKNEANPNPENSWVETNKGKSNPLSYPRILWVDGDIHHTIWAETNDGSKEFYVDEGMIFKIAPGSRRAEIYLDGNKQELDSNMKGEMKKGRPDFQVKNVEFRRGKNDSIKAEIDVRNNKGSPGVFRGCINITGATHYTQFVEQKVDQRKTIKSEIPPELVGPNRDVDIDLLTTHLRSDNN